MPESACFLDVTMANVAANLPATHPTSMFYLLKAVSVEERNCPGENSTLVYLYLKSSVQLFTTTASGDVASMREPLDGRLWWYWISANAAKKNGASFKNYHRRPSS